MKTLIAEDDFTCRLLLQEILAQYGPTHVAVNGKEAVEAARIALEAGEPYDLICLDIMMPEMDGQEALQLIRAQEEAKVGVPRGKIVMITTSGDAENVMAAFYSLCDSYLIKPIAKAKLLGQLRELGLLA